MDTQARIEIILFTSKAGQHLSLGRSFMKTMKGNEEEDICQDYAKLLTAIKRKYGAKVHAKKIYVDKVKGARENYGLDVVPVLQVGPLGQESGDGVRRFSGKLEIETVYSYIDSLE